ncbi:MULTISPECIES: primosomal replication protein N [unclassified Variovorax]|uniref:primosomal replication protein N n=1 Tax=unclassified Variovorax TaxID=663243 RepID=UPI00076C8CD1|nr:MULTISPECIES: primosomal replication protein N [unclassified Variovorax]KWT72758.1 Primosomal replication protein N [Variovorax sp. WDL1]PNG55947.1 Primosomal replication protein n [Variovorax sp. B4]PNG57371.1 Primosomal replication protein n [Variovorax sp. B2]VTV10264.1 Primosomal replication protein n [Variovorax sp. WDL1]
MSTAAANQLVLTACVAELGALRFTPAGLPAIDLRLEHESTITEAAQPRQVKAAVKAVAFGAVAERLARQALGSLWRFQGFLATPRNGKHPVLHIQDFQQD